MAEPVYDDISKIYQLLNYAEFAEALQLINSISHHSLTPEDSLRIKLAEAICLTHLGMESEASDMANKYVNEITLFPKSMQLQIIHVAAHVSLKSNDVKLARIYTDKFFDLYKNISPILQDRASSFYGDMLNVEGLLLCFDNNYSQAMALFEESMALHKKLDHPFSNGIAMFNAGKIANILRKTDRAETMLVNSYQLFKDIGYLPGQLQSAEELVITFDIQGDEVSKDLYYNITRDLSAQVVSSLMEQQNLVQLERLRKENSTLRQQLNSFHTQLNNRDINSTELESEVTLLRDKLKDFQEVKTVYEKLKEQIVAMEETINQQNSTIEGMQNIIDRYVEESHLRSLSKEKTTTAPELFIEDNLEDLLASDKLIESIYHKLEEISSAKLRILAMQLRASSKNCVQAIQRMQEFGVVQVDSWNFSNPTVTLNATKSIVN